MTPTLTLHEASALAKCHPGTLRKMARASCAALVLAVLPAACAWSPETIVEESAQQGLQLIDLSQTLDLAHTGHCTYGPPSEEFTGSAWNGTLKQVRPYVCTAPMQEVMAAPFIGRHPSDHAVYQFKAAEMALHAGVTELLVAERWRTATRVWELLTIGVQAGVDARNTQIGLRVRF